MQVRDSGGSICSHLGLRNAPDLYSERQVNGAQTNGDAGDKSTKNPNTILTLIMYLGLELIKLRAKDLRCQATLGQNRWKLDWQHN